MRAWSVWVPYPRLAETDAAVAVYTEAIGPPGPPGDVEFWVLPHPTSAATLALLRQMSRLRVVQLLSSGVDHVEPHLPAGVQLCNAPQLRARSTAEAAMCLILASLNGVAEWVGQQQRRTWVWLGPRTGLVGRTVLLVGYGAVGRALHRMLAGFDAMVVPLASRARPGVAGADELAALLPSADVVVVAVPLTAQTRGLFDADLLKRMRPGALLVNVSRGEVVDTAALLTALNEGRITAALDVTDPEPLSDGHPLWDAPGLLISPHVGGNPAGLAEQAIGFVRDQLTRYRRGERLHHQVRTARNDSCLHAGRGDPPVEGEP